MAYSCVNFQRAPEGMSNESYIWDLGEAQRGLGTREGEGAGQRPANARGEAEEAGLSGGWSRAGIPGAWRKPRSCPVPAWVQMQSSEATAEAGTPFISRS